MLSYELCKKLKENELPQEINGRIHYRIDCEECIIGNFEKPYVDNNLIDKFDISIPILEELINVCSKYNTVNNQFVLWFFEDNWFAGFYVFGSDIYIDDYPHDVSKGKTPDEAVANLYLELHKK